MNKLFETVRVGRYTLANRLAMGPMTRSRAQYDGTPGELAAEYYAQRADIGLIVTELIMNSVKYAFPQPRASARIRVTFEKAGADWKLTVSDNGTGRRQSHEPSTGLGTALVAALAKQLDAVILETSTTEGLTVDVTRASFVSRLPNAA